MAIREIILLVRTELDSGETLADIAMPADAVLAPKTSVPIAGSKTVENRVFALREDPDAAGTYLLALPMPSVYAGGALEFVHDGDTSATYQAQVLAEIASPDLPIPKIFKSDSYRIVANEDSALATFSITSTGLLTWGLGGSFPVPALNESTQISCTVDASNIMGDRPTTPTTIVVNIIGAAQPPIIDPLAPKSITSAQGASWNVTASDPDGTVDYGTLAVAQQPAAGALSFSGQVLTYDPDGGTPVSLAGGISATYTGAITVEDDEGNVSAPAVVQVTVTGAGSAPVISAMTLTGDIRNGIVYADVTAYNAGTAGVTAQLVQTDADDDADPNGFVKLSNPAYGTATVSISGAVSFTLTGGIAGLALDGEQEVTFDVQATDLGGNVSDPLTVSITLTNKGASPVFDTVYPTIGYDQAEDPHTIWQLFATAPVTDANSDFAGFASITWDNDPAASDIQIIEQPHKKNVTPKEYLGTATMDAANKRVLFDPGSDFDYLPTGGREVMRTILRARDTRGNWGNINVDAVIEDRTVGGAVSPPVASSSNDAATEGGSVVAIDLTALTNGDYIDVSDGYEIVGTTPPGLTVNPNGAWTYDPTVDTVNNQLLNGQTRQVTFQWRVREGALEGGDAGVTSNTATHTITITGTIANDPPQTGTHKLQGGSSGLSTRVAFDRHYANEAIYNMPMLPVVGGVQMSQLAARKAGYIDDDGQWIAQPPAGTTEIKSGIMVYVLGSIDMSAYWTGKRYLLTWDSETPTINDDALSFGLVNPANVTVLGARRVMYQFPLTVGGVQNDNQFYIKFTPGGSRDITKIPATSVKVRECDAAGNPVDAGNIKEIFKSGIAPAHIVRLMNEGGGYRAPIRSHLEVCTPQTSWRGGDFDSARAKYGVPPREWLTELDALNKSAWLAFPAWLGSHSQNLVRSSSKSGGPGGVATASGELSGPHIQPGSFVKLSDVGGSSATLSADGAWTINSDTAYIGGSPVGKSYGFKFQYTDVLGNVHTNCSQYVIEEFDIIYQHCRRMGREDGASILSSPWLTTEFARYLVDELIASGIDESRQTFTEITNEPWASAFKVQYEYLRGLDEYVNSLSDNTGGNMRGLGYLYGAIMNAVRAEQISRGTNYNLLWVINSQTVNPGSSQACYQGIQNYCTANGLTFSDIVGVGKCETFVTTYHDAVFWYGADGLAGAANSTSDSAFVAWWEAQVAADPVALANNVRNFVLNGAYNGEVVNWARMSQALAQHHANAQAFGTRLGGFYEGGSHQVVYSAGLLASTIFRNWYATYMGGTVGADIDRQLWNNILAIYPWVILSNYSLKGPFGVTGNSADARGAPWNQGTYEHPLTAFDALMAEFGVQP